MLASIHDKISSLVHPHRETPNQAQTTINNATAILIPSYNWDYTITFIGAKVIQDWMGALMMTMRRSTLALELILYMFA